MTGGRETRGCSAARRGTRSDSTAASSPRVGTVIARCSRASNSDSGMRPTAYADLSRSMTGSRSASETLKMPYVSMHPIVGAPEVTSHPGQP